MDILETSAFDRRQRRNTTCVLFLYLLPFFASCAIYFYLWIPDSAPSLLAAGIKASPILSLVLLVFSYNGGAESSGRGWRVAALSRRRLLPYLARTFYPW
ncbi:Lysoplasmalogenase [Labeo rohita]|uniref:Lysoplasmalogenase n=1 Tax=Labeo rohita TaxID=84645 RepID=A0ABQ8MW12_LABRO|nr:Lysoplasmalogenase [Labeo rohita]